MPLGRTRLAVAALGLVCALPGCNLDQQGIPPTPATMNFPIALGLSPTGPGEAPRYLFVANSNFDLRFNDGTLMAFDLDRVRAEVQGGPGADEPCGSPELGACQFNDIARFISSEVGIGSHADGLAVAPEGDRLYVASRSGRDLTFVDFDPVNGLFDCDQEGGDGVARCGELYRAGNEGEVTSLRQLELTGDPVDVVAGRLADIGGAGTDENFVLVALRDGRVALFVEESGGERLPTLAHIVEGFPQSLVTLAMQPGTGIGWMTSAASSALARVGVAVDPADPLRSFLYDAGSVRLGGLDDGQDNRDIAFDPARPEERAFVLSRRPESVVALDLTRQGLGSSDVAVDDAYEVGAGPSRLALAQVGGRDYVIASTFDARKLFIIDVERGVDGLVAVVGGFSGPFALAVDVVDGEHAYLYVADFSVSVIRVVDLSPLAARDPEHPPFIAATLGEPAPVVGFGN